MPVLMVTQLRESALGMEAQWTQGCLDWYRRPTWAEQGGTHHIPSSDFIAGDSLELGRSNPAEWGQMVTEAPGHNARNITQEVPMYTQGAFQSLLRSWTLNYRDSLLKVTFWREVGQLSHHLIDRF